MVIVSLCCKQYKYKDYLYHECAYWLGLSPHHMCVLYLYNTNYHGVGLYVRLAHVGIVYLQA